MAQAIQSISRVKKTDAEIRAEKLAMLENALLDNADAIVKYLHFMELLDKARMLDMANAMFEQGTDILEILVDQAAKPQYAGGIKSMIGLLQMLGSVDVNAIAKMLDSVSHVVKRAEQGHVAQMGGAFQLLGALKDPDVAAGIGFAMEVLKAVGGQFRNYNQEEATPTPSNV